MIVVVKIMKILPGVDRWYVEGEIESAMGFEDDDMKLKDYGIFLRNQWGFSQAGFLLERLLSESTPYNVLMLDCC